MQEESSVNIENFKKFGFKADQSLKIKSGMANDSDGKLPESASRIAADVSGQNSDNNSAGENISVAHRSSKKHCDRVTMFYPDHQPIDEDTSDSESTETENRSKCAAGKTCKKGLDSAQPAHTCDMCGAFVRNLLEYGKRVIKGYSREGIFACSNACYHRAKNCD